MYQKKLRSLSDLKVIGSVQIHPQAEEAERRIEAYCQYLGIKLPHFDEYTTMSSYLFPHAGTERLVVIDVLTNLLYYIDDIYSMNRGEQERNNALDSQTMMTIFKNCLDILRKGTLGNGETPDLREPLYRTMKALHDDMLRLASQAWLDRLVNDLQDHFRYSLLPVEAIMTNGRPDINKYITVREHDSGMRPTIDLLELGFGIFIPEAVRQHPVISILRTCTIRIGGLMNDIFSYHKEVTKLGSYFNLIAVYMHGEGLSFDDAVDQAVDFVNGFTETFLEYEHNMPDFGDPKLNHDVELYVLGLRDQIIATYHWQMSTNRYRAPDSPFPELRQLI
jgi:hypothetical protein